MFTRVIRPMFLLMVLTLLVGCQSNETAKPKVTNIDPAQQDTEPTTSAKSGLPGIGNPDVSATAPLIAPTPRVDKIELASRPAVVNLDDKPGPDGVSITLRLYNLEQPLAFALQTGVIEFVLYEGNIKDAEVADAEPFHVWRFSANQINNSGRKVLVGWQYALSLDWLGKPPTSSAVTLVARIPRPGGTPIYAHPVHLPIGTR